MKKLNTLEDDAIDEKNHKKKFPLNEKRRSL